MSVISQPLRKIMTVEHVSRIIESSYTFQDALTKLGLTMNYYAAIRAFAREENVKTKELDDNA